MGSPNTRRTVKASSAFPICSNRSISFVPMVRSPSRDGRFRPLIDTHGNTRLRSEGSWAHPGREASMKALALESFDVPAAVIDVPEPAAGPDEVLVRVHAASVNALDEGVAGGPAKDYMAYPVPAGLASDLTGPRGA